MASTPTSSVQMCSFKYDVFISFRGEDTRRNFVDHLYYALVHKSIYTYKDDERIKIGGRISDELITAIQDSRFYVIVFSKNYASSSWCLDELVQIMEECQKTTFHTAYPVFYDVEPTEIRYQSGSVGEAFSQLENQEAAGKWREALKDAADLAGSVLKNMFDGHEAKFIRKIVETISLDLRFVDSGIDGKLIGMESRVNGVVSALEIGYADDVRMIGIKGMGGAGKTTLARAVYDHISFHFEGKSFVENVMEVSRASLSGLRKLQKQILSDILDDQRIKVSSVHDGINLMKKRMRGQKVLVVLDDVDHGEQLRALAGETCWFKPGSRIIITTREEQVLVAHGVKLIHDVNLLSGNEAICLFSRYAFGKEFPVRGYEELSRQVVCYAAGLPLTIRVLGSFLCGQNELAWKSAIDRLNTIPLRETLEKLKLSFIGLDDDHKKLFLDVACVLKGWSKDEAVKALESCGFYATIGLRVLEQKSLITISEYGRLGMHAHIEEMGKNIVRSSNPNEINRHSRLWIQGEIENILAKDLGTAETRCLKMKMTQDHRLETFIKGLENMKKLELLDLSECDDHIIIGREVLGQCLPNSLRYLRWDFYPFESLLKSFQEDHLVGLSLPNSLIEQLWNCGEKKVLNNLKFLDMTGSCMKYLDLRMIPNIETLNLAACQLVEFNMPFECSKLKVLDLRDCKMLRTLKLAPAPDLKTLSLGGCDVLELHMPFQYPNLKSLRLNCSKLRTLNMEQTSDLDTLGLIECHDLVEFHMPNDLENLVIEKCRDLVEFHMPNECLKLKCLWLMNSTLMNLTLGLTPDLETLWLENCHDLLELHMPFMCPKLKSLNLSNTKLRTLDLAQTPNLERLDLKECYDLVGLHSIGCLEKLVWLDFSDYLGFNFFCFDKKIQSPEVVSLHLIAKSVHICRLHPDSNLQKLQFSCFYEEPIPSSYGNLEKLLSICICACINLESFSRGICDLQCLRKLKLEWDIPEVPRDLGRLACLEELYILNANNIIQLPESICMLKHLKVLEVRSCLLLENLPEDLGQIECLERLNLTECILLRDIPNSICKMTRLRQFCLCYCFGVDKLPEELGSLECLEELVIAGTSIMRLPDSIFLLKGLRIVTSAEKSENGVLYI